MKLELNARGLTARKLAPSNIHLRWANKRKLKIGDEISVKLADGTKADKPLGPVATANEGLRNGVAAAEYYKKIRALSPGDEAAKALLQLSR